METLMEAIARRYQQLRGDRVLNFRDGGIVPGRISTPNFSDMGGSTNVNVPVTVNTSNPASVDVPSFQRIIDAQVQKTINRESRPGGSLNRKQ